MMMNEKLSTFVNNLKGLTEIWMIAYDSFVKQGLPSEEARLHTKDFMDIMIGQMFESGKDKQEEESQ